MITINSVSFGITVVVGITSVVLLLFGYNPINIAAGSVILFFTIIYSVFDRKENKNIRPLIVLWIVTIILCVIFGQLELGAIIFIALWLILYLVIAVSAIKSKFTE